MAAFLYKCPITGFSVQGWVADDGDPDDDTHQAITCLACQRLHLVNPRIRKVLRSDEE
jgi:hypothetical protein